jgi:UDP-glucose 4-epimerase
MPSPLRVLVLGGAGYIGSVVTRHLIACGHEATVVDDLSTGHAWAVPAGVELHRFDVADRARLEEVLPGHDAVVHLAARSLVGESMQRPAAYYRANVGGSAVVLEAMEATGVRRLVFSSTAAVYGEPESVPIDEDAPVAPTNPYGGSKAAVDRLIGFAADASSLGAVSLRYFNVAGAAYGVGEAHDPETHLVPAVLAAAAGRAPAVRVHGTDYATPDGTAVRDYIHVADLAAAHVLALTAVDGPGHRVLNLGNGAGFSVREVVDAARRVTGRDIPVDDGPRRVGDPTVLVASAKRAHDELGWVPERPSIDEMVADAWAWTLEGPPGTPSAGAPSDGAPSDGTPAS